MEEIVFRRELDGNNRFGKISFIFRRCVFLVQKIYFIHVTSRRISLNMLIETDAYNWRISCANNNSNKSPLFATLVIGGRHTRPLKDLDIDIQLYGSK